MQCQLAATARARLPKTPCACPSSAGSPARPRSGACWPACMKIARWAPHASERAPCIAVACQGSCCCEAGVKSDVGSPQSSISDQSSLMVTLLRCTTTHM